MMILKLSVALFAVLSSAQSAYKINPTELANIRCSDNARLPTPTFGDSGIIFTVCAEQEIEASVQLVYDAILDFSRYSLWNSFVIDVKPITPPVLPQGPAPLDTKVTFITAGLLGPLNSTSVETVSVELRDGGLWDSSKAMSAWTFNIGVASAEHPNLLTDLGNGRTRYVSWESYYGPVAVLIAALKNNIQKQFEVQGEDLKRYAEVLADN